MSALFIPEPLQAGEVNELIAATARVNLIIMIIIATAKNGCLC